MKCNHILNLSVSYLSDPPKYKCTLCGELVSEINSGHHPDRTEEYKEFWKLCAASAISGGCTSTGAENIADAMLIKFKNKKF